MLGGSLLSNNLLNGSNNIAEASNDEGLIAPPLEPGQEFFTPEAPDGGLIAPPLEPGQQLPTFAPTHYSELQVTAGLVGDLTCYVRATNYERWHPVFITDPNTPSPSILLRINFREGPTGTVTITGANNIPPPSQPVPIARGTITEAQVTSEGFRVVAEETVGKETKPPAQVRPYGENCITRNTPVSLLIEGNCMQGGTITDSRIRYASENSWRGTFIGQVTCIPRPS